MTRILGRLAVFTAIALAATAASTAAGPAPGADWKNLLHADGAVDLAGPLADDGGFALAAGGRLFRLGPDGRHKTPFARGPTRIRLRRQRALHRLRRGRRRAGMQLSGG